MATLTHTAIQQERRELMNILIIDDNPLFIDGLACVLKQLAESVSITACNSIDESIPKLTRQPAFDLILLDINMPGKGGMDFMQHYSADALCIPVVIISSDLTPELMMQAMDWGAMGFIPKSHPTQQILQALRAVLDGLMYIPADVQSQLDRLATAGHH